MTWLPLASLLSCTGSPPVLPDVPRPSAFEDPGLTETGASPVSQLWRMEGRYTLPQSSLPDGFTQTSRIPIEMEGKPSKQRRATNLFRGRSPFKAALEDEGRVSAPRGMSLFVGDEEIPYNPNLAGRSWRITGTTLLVGYKSDALPPVSIEFPEVERLIERYNFGSSKLQPAEFVSHEITLDARTRKGLLLPAPAAAEWDLELPAGPVRFEGWLAIAPLPLRNLVSDGAAARLEVVHEGTTTVVDRRSVGSREQFTAWEADLSQWAGQKVTLRLATEVEGKPDFDFVFVGSPAVWGGSTGPVRRVVVIGLDTTRPDHFGFYGYERDPTPELDAVARTSTVFDHTWSPAPRTRPSFRSAFTGRRPLDAVGAKNIGAVFQEHGFATAGIVANVHLQPRFDFHQGFDDWWYDGQAKADAQVDRALAFFEHYRDRDTFLFLHLMDPHLFYNAPPAFRDMYVTDPSPNLPDTFTRWDVYRWMSTGRVDDRMKAHLTALYDAELRFMSTELGRLFSELDRMGGRSLVVLHSDHGEEFWEHDAFEHNHTVYDEVTRVLLWFRSGPGQSQGRRIDTPVTLADIGPTLFDFAGFTDTPPTDGKSLAPLLLGKEATEDWRQRPLGVAHLRYGREQWGVVLDGHKYILRTATGEEQLFDLDADPAEKKDLAPTTDLGRFRAALAEAHGMKVGRGWRIRVEMREAGMASTYRIQLPTAALAAGVIDPEATIEEPANQAWGEVPKRTPQDIGEVTLSDGDTTLTFKPGHKSQDGLLYVLFDADIDPSTVQMFRDDEPLVTLAARGKLSWKAAEGKLEIVPGTIVVPPPSEGARLRALSKGAIDEAGDSRRMLQDLGYIEEDEPGEPAPRGREEHDEGSEPPEE